MEYKENQRVMLRNDLEVGKQYGGWFFNPFGKPFIGKVVTLDEWTEYDEDGLSKGFFTIKELNMKDNSLFITKDMIDHERSKYILKDGDTLLEVFSKVIEHEQANDKGTEPLKAIVKEIDEEEPISDDSDITASNDTISFPKVVEQMDKEDNIKPSHYRTGMNDLFEAAYLTRPFNEFRAIMEFVAERYIRRIKGSPEKRIEDLRKAQYTIERLKEKEILEIEKMKELETNIKEWFIQGVINMAPSKNTQDLPEETIDELTILNSEYFKVQDDSFRLSIFKYVYEQHDINVDRIISDIYKDISRITYHTR